MKSFNTFELDSKIYKLQSNSINLITSLKIQSIYFKQCKKKTVDHILIVLSAEFFIKFKVHKTDTLFTISELGEARDFSLEDYGFF